MNINLKKTANKISYDTKKNNFNICYYYWFASSWKLDNKKCKLKKILSINFKNDENSEIINDNRNLLIHYSQNKKMDIKKDIFIKKFNLYKKYDKLRFRFLSSKAIRSLKIAVVLNKIGINTPKPIAVFDSRNITNKLISSYYITEFIDFDYNLLDIIRDDNHPLRSEVINLLPYIANDVRKMHDAGIIHNDFHAGNILCKNIKENPQFYYIDLNRARIKNNLSWKKRMKDLARLDLKEKEKKIFLKNYSPKHWKRLLKIMKKKRRRRRKFVRLKKKIRNFFNIKK